MRSSFNVRWLARFGLAKSGWRTAIRRKVAELPFCDPTTGRPLLVFLFDGLPKLLKEHPDPQTNRLAEAFAWVCFSFWQCESAFPAFPENYAFFLREQLMTPSAKRDPGVFALAELLVPKTEGASPEGRCGFNRLALLDP